MDSFQAKANYFRLCQLLIYKGGDALRRVLQAKIDTSPPPSTLISLLSAHKKSLQKLRYSVINATQWKLLFPASGSPDSNNFDITLLTILLRNVCGLPSPATGWNVMPPASDASVSAEICRIKIFRNEVYAHVISLEIDRTEFERLWQDISKPLIRLGIPQEDIEGLKEASLTFEEESDVQELKEWKALEGELQAKIAALQIAAKPVKSSGIEKLVKFFFKGKIEMLCKKFQEGTRKWVFDDVKKWLDDENSRVMILTGGPGVGKSVLSAKICQLFAESNQLAACHFCDFRLSDYRGPYKILQSLASQMCDNVDGFHDKLTETLSREHSRDSLSDTFRVLLNDPLHALDRAEPMLIVVDALDESQIATRSEFLELLSEEFPRLPKWIKIFITSRPELQVKKKLEHVNQLEILPDYKQNKQDLKHFIESQLVSVPKVESLVDKCQGSFLYAYYLVIEVEKLGIEPNLQRYVPKGISGFYEKQFGRLKKELQRYEQDAKVSIIFESFVNVVAAAESPLPLSILFTCMDLLSENSEVRKAIVGIMSEILPVYDDCLTVFHESLWDWLKLDGYEEHAYAADVADGKKRLWRACKKVYIEINSLSSISDFQISSAMKYALKNGWEYLWNVDDVEDFEWFVNVKVNYLKFKCDGKEMDVSYMLDLLLIILQEYRSKVSGHLYSHIRVLFCFLKVMNFHGIPHNVMCYMYLQTLKKWMVCEKGLLVTLQGESQKSLSSTNT